MRRKEFTSAQKFLTFQNAPQSIFSASARGERPRNGAENGVNRSAGQPPRAAKFPGAADVMLLVLAICVSLGTSALPGIVDASSRCLTGGFGSNCDIDDPIHPLKSSRNYHPMSYFLLPKFEKVKFIKQLYASTSSLY